jgi:ABC-type lipoprotein release transport system permease subunit
MTNNAQDASQNGPGEARPSDPRPPLLADRLLEWCCPPRLLEDVQGDLQEVFRRQAQREGIAKARRAYWRAVLAYVRPFYLSRKPKPYPKPLFTDMFRHYATVALRQIRQNKAFSFLNVLGLALGLTCSLLILLWVRDEVSVDGYHANGPHLYRVMWRQLSDGKREAMPETPWPVTLEMPGAFPEIVRAAGLTVREQQMLITIGDKAGKERGEWAGTDWFKMFSVPLLAGSPETALASPDGVAISRKLAENYFGGAGTAIGKFIKIDHRDNYRVTAVFENLPAQSSLRYDFLLSWDDFVKRNDWARGWGSPNPWAFVQLRANTDAEAFAAKIKHFARGRHPSIDPANLQRFDVELFLQPFEDIYLHSQTENGEITGGRIGSVRLFTAVAAFLLTIACINFMNLATARSARRAKEVGIRKVVGAGRSRLIGQFMGEAIVLTGMALGVALLAAQLLLPVFNELTGKDLRIPYAEPRFGLALVGMLLGTGLLAGSYPALFLSSLQPIRVLKGPVTAQPGGKWFRQGLVVVQFVISMLLMIGTAVVYRQLQFIQTKNLGYDRENLISVPLEGDLLSKHVALRQQLGQMPGIEAVTLMGQPPNDLGGRTWDVQWPGKDPDANIIFARVHIGYDMTEVLKVKMVEGREFSPRFATDSAAFIINQEAARRMGFANPVGQPLTFWGKPGKIIGVVQNFHFQSLHEPIMPLIMHFGENADYGHLFVRTRPGQTRQALTSLQAACKKFAPGVPFTYSFANREYEKMYRSEQVTSALINYFAGLAIFIACLGLFGLAAFTAERRTKEIGIRKVLGASLSSLVGLLSGDFVRLVLLAVLIAYPLGGWLMHEWLQHYEYRIRIDAWIYLGTGLVVVGVALLTVSFQAIKAALADPVKSLRSE